MAPSVVLGVIIVFHPEIRRAIVQLGDSSIFRYFFRRDTKIVPRLLRAIARMSKERVGALIAIERDSTLSELTDEIARQSGKAVTYRNLPESEFKTALLNAGLPDFLATLLAESDVGASKGGLFDDERQLSNLIGRPTTPMAEQIRVSLLNH